ncbi:MAG: OmpH family outer membrane protein [Myxococcota bacterium]|nr:OmpH family outer membrane protein [Myxococcota bacterium]
MTQLAIALLATVALVGVVGADGDPNVKIGVVDVDQALNSTDEGKAAREELSRKQREAESEVQPLIDRYQNLEEELKGKKYVLSDDALFDKQVELAELRNKIETKIKELEGQMKIEQGKVLAPLTAKLGEIIEEIGKDKGFTLILRRDAQGVMYTREALDITDLVVEKFNNRAS